MPGSATFTGPGGAPPGESIRYQLQCLTTPTTGDLMDVGQKFRARIRNRTFSGVDVDGASFAPYSTKGPYYFYPNRDAAGSIRGASEAVKASRATAAKGRHAATKRLGVRTPYGIRYASYAAAKAAHGVANVNLYGMEQHPHMLDKMVVRAGGMEADMSMEGLGIGGEMDAFDQVVPEHSFTIGFYGDEAARAKGNDKGTSNVPQRHFFALNAEDVALGESIVVQRMTIRAQRGGGGMAPAPSIASVSEGPVTIEDVGF